MLNSTQQAHSGVDAPADAGSTPTLRFFQAAATDDLSMLKQCAKKEHVPLTSRDHENSTAAHIAAAHGSLMSLKYLLDRCPTLLLETDARGKTVLHRAVVPDFPKMVSYLLDEQHVGMYLRCSTPAQNTVVHEAAELNRLRVMQYLYEEKKADLEVRNERGETPIFFAAANGQIKMLKYLMDVGKVDPTVTDSDGNSILFSIVCTGDAKTLKFFQKKGIYFDENLRNKRGESALHRAVQCGRLDSVELLADRRSTDLEIKDNQGRTPLYVAAQIDNVDIVRLLVSKGAEVDIWAADGTRLLDVAKSPQVLECLQAPKEKVLVRPRTARHADPIFVFSRSEVEQHPALTSDDQAAAAAAAAPSSSFASPPINAFLVFAIACIRYIFRS